MTDVERAMAHLADIRSQMAAGTRFRGIAPAIVVATGFLALAASLLQSLLVAQMDSGQGFILFWIAVAIVASVMIGMEALGRARRFHGGMADTMIGSTLRLFLPFGAAGAIITFVIMRVAPGVWWILPGLWQLVVALLGFAASTTTLPRSMAWAGGWYLISATVVLTLAGQDGVATPWMMGLPFGLGQFIAAALLHSGQREV